jgi:general secretion pathway protein C
MLGFRDGDRLESINGFDLSTPEDVLTAYKWLRTADNLEARVRRDGKIVTLHYRLW